MSMTIEERFTSLGWEDDSKIAHVTTCNRSLQRQLTKYCKDYPNSYKKTQDIIFEGEDEVDIMEFEIDKNLITFMKPKKLSEEKRKAASERMKKNQEKMQKARNKID